MRTSDNAEKKGSVVFGLVGSPRKKGNTSRLVEAVLAGAESRGAQTRKVYLQDCRIGFCRACDKCGNAGECFQKDDMAGLLAAMKESRIWVIGTPVYWWGPSAQMKVFMDRWYQDERRLKRLAGRKVILALPFANSNRKTARHVLGMFRDSFAHLEKEIFEVILAPGVFKPKDLDARPEILEKAFRTGARVIGA